MICCNHCGNPEAVWIQVWLMSGPQDLGYCKPCLEDLRKQVDKGLEKLGSKK